MVHFKVSRMQRISTREHFEDFFRARAYDLIGEGTFRRHLSARKDSGDAWAVKMSSGIHSVTADVRMISSQIAHLCTSFPVLGDICKNVVLAAHPPIRIHGVQAKCALTQQLCSNCLCLPSGTKNVTVYVHMRFCRFFVFLWFICKIEYIVRCYIRCWLQTQEINEQKPSFQKLAEQIDLMSNVTQSLFDLFSTSYDHVVKSIAVLAQAQSEPVIENITQKIK